MSELNLKLDHLLPSSDQSFDIPDRTFHSMNTTWRLSSYESMTDVKELIPEFFYLPEFLVNREGIYIFLLHFLIELVEFIFFMALHEK